MTNPSTASCPRWDDDGPATRGSVFRRNVAAAYRDMEQVASRAILDATICVRWHRIIFSSSVPLNYYAGNFRQIHPNMPCLNLIVAVGGIPGHLPQHVISSVHGLFSDIRLQMIRTELNWSELTEKDRALRVAVTLGNLVGQFIRIHPFMNGNGRTSRLIWAWGMRRFGLPFQVRVTMRPEDPRYADMMAAAMRGSFADISLYMLNHISKFRPQQVIN